jgi:hypothetical protein
MMPTRPHAYQMKISRGPFSYENGDMTRGDRAGNHSRVSLEFARPEVFLSPFHYLEVAGSGNK